MWPVTFLFIFLCVLQYGASKSIQYYKDVETNEGVVRGYLNEIGNYYAYTGIPYAAPPVGKARFKAPTPPSPRDYVYEANQTVYCPQWGIGDEDCLFLNIFTPTIILKHIPVLVYIHGGSFLIGTGLTSGFEELIKEDVIVVTINYRIGALGFLCLGIEEAPGNAGLKDQVAALRWLKSNIANFGGDAKQVTIYGMSAGGVSVDYQVLSKMGKGLFHRAIIESGSATTVWATDANPIATAYNVAEMLGLPKTSQLDELVEFYQEIPADKLTLANTEYYTTLIDGTFGFVPCVEKELEDIESFITKSPHDILNENECKTVPIMAMYATLEGLFLRSAELYEQNYAQRMQANFTDFIPRDLVIDDPMTKSVIADQIKEFYFGNNSIGDNVIDYLNYFGDNLILHGLLNSVEIRAMNKNLVYLMEFEYRGNMGGSASMFENITKAGHGDIMQHAILQRKIQNDDDRLTVNRIVKLITNFMKHDNPTPTPSELLPVTWPAVKPGVIEYFHLNKDLKVLRNPYTERKQFWDKLYAKFRGTIKPVGD